MGRSVPSVTGKAMGPSQEEGEGVEASSDDHGTGKEIAQPARSKHPGLLGAALFGVRLRQLVDGVLWFAKVSFSGSHGWHRALVVACCGR